MPAGESRFKKPPPSPGLRKLIAAVGHPSKGKRPDDPLPLNAELGSRQSSGSLKSRKLPEGVNPADNLNRYTFDHKSDEQEFTRDQVKTEKQHVQRWVLSVMDWLCGLQLGKVVYKFSRAGADGFQNKKDEAGIVVHGF